MKKRKKNQKKLKKNLEKKFLRGSIILKKKLKNFDQN